MQSENKTDPKYTEILEALPGFYRIGNHIRNAGELPNYTVVGIELTRSGRSAVVVLEYNDGKRKDILISIAED